MSLLSENVIPGNHGKIFETNAKKHQDLIKIKDVVSTLDGVIDVIINENEFPKKITVHTSTLVSVKEIEQAVFNVGFHVLPKSLFKL